MPEKVKAPERERRDWTIILIILLLGFLCVILAGEQALRFSPNWKLYTSMNSKINPDSVFLTSRPSSFIEPLDPSILLQPAIDLILTPGAVSNPQSPAPTANAIPNTPVPVKTTAPTLVNDPTNTPVILVATPTNTSPVIPAATLTFTPIPAPSANLQITVTDGSATYVAGGSTKYIIVVSNPSGPSNVTGATVTDTFPAQITNTSWTCVVAGGATCPANGTGNINATVNIPVGGSATFTVNANISPSATGNLVYTAKVAVPVGVTDPVLGNNTATDTDTLTTINADLSITKSNGVIAVNIGGSTTYTIRVTNNGPNNVIGAILTDSAATGLSKTAVACSATSGQCVTAPTIIQLESGSFALPILNNGQFYEITVTADVTAGSGSVTNTATITAPSGITDPSPGNNSASDTDTVAQTADLSITKSDGVSVVGISGSTTYTVRVTNNGLNNVAGAILSDPAATGLSKTAVACSATPGQCVTAPTITELESGSFALPTLNNGQFFEITVTTNVTVMSGSVTNTATVAVPSGITDPSPGNNSASDTNTVVSSINLSITKSDGITLYSPGNMLTYTIIVTNPLASAATASGFNITDTVPLLGTLSVACIPSGSGSSCGTYVPPVFPATTIMYNNVTLSAGDTLTITITGRVSVWQSGPLINTVDIVIPGGASFTDPDTSNNSATDTDNQTLPTCAVTIDVPGTSTVNITGGQVTCLRFTDPSLTQGAILSVSNSLTGFSFLTLRWNGLGENGTGVCGVYSGQLWFLDHDLVNIHIFRNTDIILYAQALFGNDTLNISSITNWDGTGCP